MDARSALNRAISFGELIFTMGVPEIMYQFCWTDKAKGRGMWRYHNGKYWVYVDESQVAYLPYDSREWGCHPSGTEPLDVLANMDKERVLKYTLYEYPVGQISPQEV